MEIEEEFNQNQEPINNETNQNQQENQPAQQKESDNQQQKIKQKYYEDEKEHNDIQIYNNNNNPFVESYQFLFDDVKLLDLNPIVWGMAHIKQRILKLYKAQICFKKLDDELAEMQNAYENGNFLIKREMQDQQIQVYQQIICVLDLEAQDQCKYYLNSKFYAQFNYMRILYDNIDKEQAHKKIKKIYKKIEYEKQQRQKRFDDYFSEVKITKRLFPPANNNNVNSPAFNNSNNTSFSTSSSSIGKPNRYVPYQTQNMDVNVKPFISSEEFQRNYVQPVNKEFDKFYEEQYKEYYPTKMQEIGKCFSQLKQSVCNIYNKFVKSEKMQNIEN